MAASRSLDVYLEIGSKRVFAGAVNWPGWCRHGKTEEEALAALLAHGPRYAEILSGSPLRFTAPRTLSQLKVVERVAGNATTDFGAPAVAPAADQDRTCDRRTLTRMENILQAGWRAFDAAAASAKGRTLTSGPRGGGRSLSAIVSHVIESNLVYLAAVGWKTKPPASGPARLAATRQAILDALHASASGEIEHTGPRGGVRWTARYFVRRVAWHEIAHVWEIERRSRE
jgi:hypothetical protein